MNTKIGTRLYFGIREREDVKHVANKKIRKRGRIISFFI